MLGIGFGLHSGIGMVVAMMASWNKVSPASLYLVNISDVDEGVVPDFRREGRPTEKEELFNYLHSSLRNAIERVFGILKNKWRILKYIPSYGLDTQKRIILACIALHNFIRDSQLRDKQFDRCDADENYIPKIQRQSIPLVGDIAPSATNTYDMKARRESIATALFNATRS